MEDQHFMVDKETIKIIVAAAEIKKSETILEIGAGHGELTEFLGKISKVIAIEKDKKLCDFLFRKFGKNKKVQIIHGNALKEIEKLEFDKIVSNPPYAILEPLLKKLMRKTFSLAVLTVPRNFFEKIKTDVLYTSFFDIKFLFPVSRVAFSPPPRTESVVMSVTPRKDLDSSFLIRQVFLSKAKVRNSLREGMIEYQRLSGNKMTKKQSKEFLKNMQFPQNLLEKKGPLLTKKEFHQLFALLKQLI